MVDRKQVFDGILEEAAQADLIIVQLSEKVNMKKPALEDDCATARRIQVNSKMATVFLSERLTEVAFFTMLDQMLSSLLSFTSHGSGWMLKDISGFCVKLVYVRPHSSFIPPCSAKWPSTYELPVKT